MNAPRFLIDECIGKPSMMALKALVPDDLEFAHICDIFGQGAQDKDWIPQIAEEGRWVVITSDGGKKSNRGGKLPRLCEENGITHVVMSPSLHSKRADEKVAALVMVWDRLMTLGNEVPGTRFKLQYRASKGTNALTLLLQKVEPDAQEPIEDPDTSS